MAAADALHTCFLVLLLCSAVWQGASNYHYTFGAKVEKALRVALQAEVTKGSSTAILLHRHRHRVALLHSLRLVLSER